MKKIPIVIFAYNRPSHFKKVMIALQNNKIKNKIYLFLDGQKIIMIKFCKEIY